MKNKSLISITDYNKDELLQLINLAEYFEENPEPSLLHDKVIASLFFEPSTRTRLSFETAIQRLGGKIIGFTDASTSSVQKGESLRDTITNISLYADLIVMRHPLEGAARFASEVSHVPIINAGDGANQHPTQCMLDLFSIKKTQGTLENLNITLVGDLKYGRTIHSLVQAMSNFNATFYLVSPDELRLPATIIQNIKDANLKYYEMKSLEEAIPLSDLLYMTRVQRERFADPLEYEKVKNSYILKNSMLVNSKPNLKVMHPLPRVNEISIDVDENPKAYYFQQALNGVYMREALLARILGLK
ncbi:MAG: aspartate carbamoyltransferase [Bacteroidales bacterium]|jgi:aspartate carbamoyltransferase catalytic subunit|nr:aspartate carbamoyltransferase [Bacteroidales bacterium]